MFRKSFIWFIKTDTNSGDLEGFYITKIAKPLLKRFFLDFGTALADGAAGSYSDTVTNTDGDKISRVDSEDVFKAGIGSGVSNATQNVANTYSAQWGEIIPTIAIEEGSRVQIYISEEIEFPELILDHNETTDLTQLY